MSGNMPRWNSSNILQFETDTSSQYSATDLNVSAGNRIRSPDIGQRLRVLFKQQLYTDVKFVISCGVKPKPTLRAHKAVLAIGSEKFREILYDDKSQTPSDELQINNIPFEAFRNVVEYLYTDDVIFENDQSVLETLSAAMKFQVQSLVFKCESYIESVELTEDNVCSKLQMAASNSLESLKSRCIEFIQENTSSVLRSADFLASNTSTVHFICNLEKFNLRSEIGLLYGIIRWVDARPGGRVMSKRTLVEPFLKYVRLLNVSCEEFNQFVQRQPSVFTTPEATSILISLANPNKPSSNLPEWCKRSSNRCTGIERSFRPVRHEQRLPIYLRSTSSPIGLVTNITCALVLKCFRGRHQIQGLKLAFDDPVHELSIIGDLRIHVRTEPSNFGFNENIRIENSKHVELRFSKRLLAKRGDTIYIKATALNVQNYKFLQFDDNGSASGNSPFICNLGSEPKENRLYFISEVVYHDAPSLQERHDRPRRYN